MKIKTYIGMISYLAVFLTSLIFTSITNAEELSQVDKAFYNELSCKASSNTVIALIETLKNQGVPQIEINIDAFQRWPRLQIFSCRKSRQSWPATHGPCPIPKMLSLPGRHT